LLLGARYQDLDEHSVSEAPSLGLPIQDVTYEKGVFLPRVGLLWNPRPWISAYYSYSENMGANTGLDFSGRPIKPESARQHELGLKGEWMNGRLNALIAVFELTKLNIASADPAHPGFNIGVGEVRSTGYEINVQGAITDKWNVLTNFSFARPFVEEGTEASSIYSGPSIVAGQLLPYVSNKTFSLWTGYRLFGEPNAGLTVGGGVNWSSAANPADGAVVETESHTVASVFSAYETTMASKKVTFQINVNNIFDERYLMFQGDDVVFGGNTLGGNWNAPRQFKFSLIAEF
jgi:iron complex outermembrane receptor protein